MHLNRKDFQVTGLARHAFMNTIQSNFGYKLMKTSRIAFPRFWLIGMVASDQMVCNRSKMQAKADGLIHDLWGNY